MNGDTPRWSWRSSSHRQKSNNKPGLTWTSLRALSPKKDNEHEHEHDGSAKKHRRGSMETSSISTTRPRFAAPTTTSHCNEPVCNGAARTNSTNDTEAGIMHRLEPIHSYLMLSTPNGAENSRRLDSHLESNNTPYSIGTFLFINRHHTLPIIKWSAWEKSSQAFIEYSLMTPTTPHFTNQKFPP